MEFNLCRIALFFHSTASLVMGECACAVLVLSLQVPSLVCVNLKYVCELIHFFLHFSIHPYIYGLPWLGAVDVHADCKLLCLTSIWLGHICTTRCVCCVTLSGLCCNNILTVVFLSANLRVLSMIS